MTVAPPVPSAPPRVPYAGLATRAVGLAVDSALVHVIVFAGGAMLALVASLVGLGEFGTLEKILAAVAWAVVAGAYFVLFWSTAGQTPGMRLMGLRVTAADGLHPSVGRSLLRLVGLVLAIIPLGAGFLTVLVDDRRRALQDLIARTVVIYDLAGGPPPPLVADPAVPRSRAPAATRPASTPQPR